MAPYRSHLCSSSIPEIRAKATVAAFGSIGRANRRPLFSWTRPARITEEHFLFISLRCARVHLEQKMPILKVTRQILPERGRERFRISEKAG
jgi:hypothetical protein